MVRITAAVLVALAAWAGASAQELPVLHVTVTVVDADRRPIPVARHALLVSENPTSAVPRRVVTTAAGTALLRLQPGNYTVESDRPFVLDGRSYEWTQVLDIKAGHDATLELTAANAVVSTATPELTREAAVAADVPETRSAAILSTWQASAFGLWTPLAHAAGFLADERGLVVTSLRAIGDARTVEVEVSATTKATGAVIASDARRDVAVVRVHPSAVEGVRPVPLACDAPGASASVAEPYLIDVPMRGSKDVTSDLSLSAGAAGGPVFAGDGRAIGLSSPVSDAIPLSRATVRVVSASEICAILTTARTGLDAATAPDAARLPIERAPLSPNPAGAAGTVAAFSLSPYQMALSEFDVSFLTPALLASAETRRGWTGVRADELNGLRVATDFENWSDYVETGLPVLYVRVTPRPTEGFWMKVARGAASTQGAQIPPIKRLRSAFAGMRLLCGGKDVPPIHPFRIRARVTETEAVEEGFYVFDPAAIGPQCGTVSIVLSSMKDPGKTETRTVTPAIVTRIWQDLAAYRLPSGHQ